MDNVHNRATALRNQIAADTLPGGDGGLPADWVTRFFNWYAQWSAYYWEHRPKSGSRPGWPWIGPPLPDDDSWVLPADDTVWAYTEARGKELDVWKGQYEQLSGRPAEPHALPVPPPKSPANHFNAGLDTGGVGSALGLGAAAAVVLLLLSR